MAKSKADKRHEKIRGMLIARDLVTVSEFCEELHCSMATIRNDLRLLEQTGLLKRSHGGAIATGKTAIHTNMEMRSTAFHEEKKLIAQYVTSTMLKPDLTIILDSGSTCFELASNIVESNLELTAITNSFTTASILIKSPKIRLYLASGCYDHQTESFHDELAQGIFTSLRADICFLSVNGISSEAGFTISGHEEAPMKKAMINSAQKTVVLADHSKIGKIGLKVICGLEEVAALVCDPPPDNRESSLLANAGLNIEFAQK